MVRICGACHWFLGLKAPWLNWRIAHVLCARCHGRLKAYAQSYGLGS
jgi:hypothetical protein